ncbi:MAG: O-antigen ligase family protein [Betaproteobacteria bacterium]|nr:O-antigen ligase family protein [Betaproteobacteria bacterium]
MDRGFEIAKQSLAEPLAVLALGAALLAGGWRWVMQQGVATKTASIALAAFLVLAGVSVALGEMPEVALFGSYFRREGLVTWLVYGAFFFAVLGWAHHSGRLTGFLDALLLASVIPAAYAIQQRLGLDFYPLGARDLTRPGGTLGNPVFLAAYLGLLLPITVVRCWQARRRLSELAPWLIVTVLQACGLLLTQTRGPLLAAVIGLVMLACFAAGYARARRVFLGAAAAFAVVVAALIAINTLPGAKQWAQDAPVAGRLVFDLDRDAGAATAVASRSAAARLGMWRAGAEIFAAAPLRSQLFGYGPDSAYMHFFPYTPVMVMQAIGYKAINTNDRLHADTLDIGLNFGLLGWLAYGLFFGSVMFAAARALFGLSGSAPAWMFFAFTFWGGVLSSAAAVLTGLAAAAVPAFGLGMSAGWFLFLVGCAWRALKHGVPQTAGIHPGHRALLAGLTSALLVFWVDAQVNIPVLTTRLISFGIAAFILVIGEGMVRRAGDGANSESAAGDNLWVWGIAFSLVAAYASFLPVATFDATTGARETGRWWLRTLPILSILLIAALAAWARARRSGGVGSGVAWSWLAIAVGLPMLYAAGHFALMVKAEAGPGLSDVQSISIASFAGPIFIFGMCIVLALLASRGTVAPPLSRAARFSIFALAASVLLVASLHWRSTRADVASAAAQWAYAKQPQVSEQLVEEAIRIMPYEQYYQRQLIFDLLGRAVADIRELGRAPDRYPMVERNLAVAELQARETLKLFPRDAWSVLALANVLQVRALRFLRPLAPAAGGTAALEANQLFALAHRMFPAQPLVLRNWAQLLFDQDNLPDAYRLLDLMEKLVPNELEPYYERIVIAKQVNDFSVISATLERARGALEPRLFNQLLVVANAQQNL